MYGQKANRTEMSLAILCGGVVMYVVGFLCAVCMKNVRLNF